MCWQDVIIMKHTHTVFKSVGFTLNTQTLVFPPDKNRIGVWMGGGIFGDRALISFGNPPTVNTGFTLGGTGIFAYFSRRDVGDIICREVWGSYSTNQTNAWMDVLLDFEAAYAEIEAMGRK